MMKNKQRYWLYTQELDRLNNIETNYHRLNACAYDNDLLPHKGKMTKRQLLWTIKDLLRRENNLPRTITIAE